jgi:hypothetical protein
MKKSSTVATASNKNFGQERTIGLPLGDRSTGFTAIEFRQFQ